MNKSEKIYRLLKKNRLVALLNPQSKQECITAYELFKETGVVLEVALRSESAEKGIKHIFDRYPEALILAGTVMTKPKAERVIEMGVAGVVSADYIPDVVKVCVDRDVMCIPGGLSDIGKQLVQKAENQGCTLEQLRENYPYQWVYKLFPAFSGGLNNMPLKKAWTGPYSDVTVFYTGGVKLDNLIQANSMDPNGIFCASALTKHIHDPDVMKQDIKQWKSVLSAKRKKSASPKKSVSRPKQTPSVVTFGELMLRLSPVKGVRLKNSEELKVHFGGAEANVAVCLAQFGFHSSFVSVIPSNDIGDNALACLKKFGVNTCFIQRKGDRLGIYYLEHGSGPRPSKVIYDRKGSSITRITPEEINWEDVFKDVQWFHWTGITPALGPDVEQCLQSALKAAKKAGIQVSVDLNYRKKLWSEDKAREVMTELMEYTDVMMGNEEDPTRVFGIQSAGSDVNRGKLNMDGYQRMVETLCQRFDFKKVAVTLRESLSATENMWSACLYNGQDFILGPKHKVWITDRVGTGDAFAAGLIYSLLSGQGDKQALEFGIASAVLKHTVWGDFNVVTVEEVKRLAQGEDHGRVLR
ncbi:MAG: hypothetical protein GF421_06895 [Candidatus Aminicenantes bacterium]|nr:hypothetical protein [Candidatus Aminicenantes bacterium]